LSEFFNFTKDGFLDLNSLARGIFDDMVYAWSQMLAQMINQWLLSGIGGLLSGAGFAGFNVNALLGGGTAAAGVSGALGAGGAIAGGGAAGGLASVGAGATGTVAGGAAFEAFAVAPEAATSTATASIAGMGSLGTMGLAVGGTFLLGPTITGAMKSLVGSGVTAPSAQDYINSWILDLPQIPGWEGSDSRHGGIGWQENYSRPNFLYPSLQEKIKNQLGTVGSLLPDNILDMAANQDLAGIMALSPGASSPIMALREWVNENRRYYDRNTYDIPGAQYGGVIEDVFKPAPWMRIPSGDNGLIAAQRGEGIVNKTGMKVLDMINSGQFPIIQIENKLHLDGRIIARSVAKYGPKDPEYIKMSREINA
ncbi:MAG: hypothetical protein ACFFCW_37675, partial [Candidatus Hodarchaeota archaeon]